MIAFLFAASSLLQSNELLVEVQVPAKDPLLTVIANHVPALEVFQAIGDEIGIELTFSEDAQIQMTYPLESHLKNRRLSEILPWLTGAIGLTGHTTRRKLVIEAPGRSLSSVEQIQQQALSKYRVALLKNVNHPEAPRIRFEIANIHLSLKQYAMAVAEYDALLNRHPEFPEVPLAYYRKGFAYAGTGNDSEAINTWLQLIHDFEDHPLVPAARLECVEAYRRLGETNPEAADIANLHLRYVIEYQRGLSAEIMIKAGTLLLQGNDAERAVTAFQRALRRKPENEINERALAGLARAHAGMEQWQQVIATVHQYQNETPKGPNQAAVYYDFAVALTNLKQFGRAVLAFEAARQSNPSAELLAQINLAEGKLWGASGVAERALPLLFQATQTTAAKVAATALKKHAFYAIHEGLYHKARQSFERLKVFPGHEVDAGIGLARVALAQRQHQNCFQFILDTIPLAEDPAHHTELVELAREVLRKAPSLAAMINAESMHLIAAPEK